MKERIRLIVNITISYPEKSKRKDAIKAAINCVTSSSILGTSCSVVPGSAKVHKPKV